MKPSSIVVVVAVITFLLILAVGPRLTYQSSQEGFPYTKVCIEGHQFLKYPGYLNSPMLAGPIGECK